MKQMTNLLNQAGNKYEELMKALPPTSIATDLASSSATRSSASTRST